MSNVYQIYATGGVLKPATSVAGQSHLVHDPNFTNQLDWVNKGQDKTQEQLDIEAYDRAKKAVEAMK